MHEKNKPPRYGGRQERNMVTSRVRAGLPLDHDQGEIAHRMGITQDEIKSGRRRRRSAGVKQGAPYSRKRRNGK